MLNLERGVAARKDSKAQINQSLVRQSNYRGACHRLIDNGGCVFEFPLHWQYYLTFAILLVRLHVAKHCESWFSWVSFGQGPQHFVVPSAWPAPWACKSISLRLSLERYYACIKISVAAYVAFNIICRSWLGFVRYSRFSLSCPLLQQATPTLANVAASASTPTTHLSSFGTMGHTLGSRQAAK